MKTKLPFIIFLLFSLTIFSQNEFNRLIQKHPLHTKKQCRNAKSIVLSLSNYLIDNPIDKKISKRINAEKYIQRWIVQTPDYNIEIPQEIQKITKDKKALRTVHKAFLVKYVLTHNNTDTKNKKVRRTVLLSFLKYIENSNNNVIITKDIKHYIQLRNNKKLYKIIQ
jgi:hypothetical protein